MKFAVLSAVVIATLLFAGPAQADTNVALEGGTYGPTGIFGANSSDNSTFIGSNGYSFADSQVNDGVTNSGNDSTFGQGNGYDGFVGITFTTPVTASVTSVVFYGGLFADGGWFGVNGADANGTPVVGSPNYPGNYPSTLSVNALIAPTLQVSYNYSAADPDASTWVNVLSSNNYVTQLTNAPLAVLFQGTTSTLPVTYTPDTPLTDITAIRLIGETGGFASNGGGFLGGHEFEVVAPEPSTYAMMLGGLVLLGFCIRRRLT